MRASSERSAMVKHGNGPGESSRDVFSIQKQGMSESDNGRGVEGRAIWVDEDGLRGEISSHTQTGGGMKRSEQVKVRKLSNVRSEGEQGVDVIGRRKQGSRKEGGANLEVVVSGGRVVGQAVSESEIGKSKEYRSDVKGGEQSGEIGFAGQSIMVVGVKDITWELSVGNFNKEGGVCGGRSGSGEGGTQQGLKGLKMQFDSGEVNNREIEQEVEECEFLGGPKGSGVCSKGLVKVKGRKGRQSGREVMLTGKSASPSLKLKIAQLRRKRGVKGQNGSPSHGESVRDFKKISKSPSRAAVEFSEVIVSKEVAQKRRKLAFVGDEIKETRISDGTQESEGGVIIVAAEPVEQARRQP